MVVQALPRFRQLLVAACLLVACQTDPALQRSVAVTAGERTTVHLVQVNGSLALSLQNASAQKATDVYGADTSTVDPGRKVVDDVNLQTLLDVFATKGMFATSLGEVPPGSLDALIVEQGRRRWVWAVSSDKRVRLAAQQRGDHSEQIFNEARAEFLELYNRSTAFHGTGTDRPDFRAEGARAKTDSTDSRRSPR